MPKNVPLIFPRGGVSTEAAFIDQPGDTCVPGASKNIRLYDRSKKRPRGGSRGGWSPLLAGSIGTGMVQALISVNRASTTGYNLGTASDIVGTAKSGTHGTGNGTLLDEVPSVERMIYDDTSDDGGPATSDIVASCFSADKTLFFTATNYTNGTNYKSRIKCWNASTGALVWSNTISEVGVDRFTNTICASSWLLLVSGGKSTGVGTVRTIKITDGTLMGSDFTFNGWAYEAIEAGTYGSGSGEYALLAFYGSAAAGTTVGGAIDPGFIALNFRSGVMRCRIIQPTETGPFGFYLTQVSFAGIGLASTDPLYEANHRTMRISEIAANDGHGAVIESLAVGPTGAFAYTRSNQGYGRDATLTPATSGLPYVSVAAHAADGTLVWQNNVAESVTDIAGPYGYNDLNDPTLVAIAIDAVGNVYVGGRNNSAGYSVYSLTNEGAFRWRCNIGVQVRQACLRVDPFDGNILVGGDRNNLWEGAAGNSANAWKISANDGSILWGWDFNSAVSTSSVAAGGGRLFLGTEYVS